MRAKKAGGHFLPNAKKIVQEYFEETQSAGERCYPERAIELMRQKLTEPKERMTLEQTKSLISRLIQKANAPSGRFRRHMEEEEDEEMEWEEQSCPVPDDKGGEEMAEDDRLLEYIWHHTELFFLPEVPKPLLFM